ncbi:FET Ferroxidase [Tothia fuscella]|uniref:FET Ferroxidase n=1 Tax=Tothia fuscella TaxID=1048955 RepID=A0A9P4TUQ5_9PEZI|nr:FET Ferroxidase [Tothia fuscella]
MTRSLSGFLNPISLLLFTSFACAATVTYDFNITWTKANPDGQFERSVIGINNQWPIPTIRVNIGDQLIVNAYNGLGNVSTALHFHGMFQNGTTNMDGPAGVTQCGIAPGSSFTYNFTVAQPGTYWYHSHVRGQYPDGLRGPFIVNDPNSPFKDQYDEEIVLTLADWYHQLPSTLLKRFISYANPTGAEPVPESALMNDTQGLKIHVEPGKTYMFRVVNMAAFAAQYFWIEGHTMQVIEVDGVYTDPMEASMLYFTAAQRYSFLVTAKNDTKANFAIVAHMDEDLFDAIPAGLNSNVTSWLTYEDNADFPQAKEISVEDLQPFDDFDLVPVDKMELLGEPDQTVSLDMIMDNLSDGANYAFFNGITYVRPKVPTVFTALTSGEMATNPAIYGVNSHAFVLKKDEIVDVVLNNLDPGKHPFHLHGHTFQVIARSQDDEGVYANNVTFPKIPMRRDTVLVRPNGNFVLRFKADNPGIWLFHCHIEWHMASGLSVTMIENPLDLQKSLTIPEDHYKACKEANIPTIGNAAGNTKDLLDLSGANVSPKPIPAGFTTRGIVALVFSILAAFIGLAVISWYGAAPLGASTQVAAEKEIAEAQMEHDIARGINTGSVPVSH